MLVDWTFKSIPICKGRKSSKCAPNEPLLQELWPCWKDQENHQRRFGSFFTKRIRLGQEKHQGSEALIGKLWGKAFWAFTGLFGFLVTSYISPLEACEFNDFWPEKVVDQLPTENSLFMDGMWKKLGPLWHEVIKFIFTLSIVIDTSWILSMNNYEWSSFIIRCSVSCRIHALQIQACTLPQVDYGERVQIRWNMSGTTKLLQMKL